MEPLEPDVTSSQAVKIVAVFLLTAAAIGIVGGLALAFVTAAVCTTP